MLEGTYKYTFDDHYSEYVTIDSSIDNSIELPVNSRDISFPESLPFHLVITSKERNYFGTVLTDPKGSYRLFNDVIYSYTIIKPFHYPKSGTFTTNNIDQNSSIRFPEPNKRTASVKFNTSLPDGERVISSVFINDKFYERSDSTFPIYWGINKFRFRYIDTTLNDNEDFTFSTEDIIVVIENDQQTITAVLKLQ